MLVQCFGLTVVDEMAQPIDVLSDDRGLRACMDGANVAAEWREALTKAHSISTLDDFIYLVTASEWEASLRDLVQAAGSPVKDNRIALARFKSAWEAGAAALKQAMTATPSAQDPDAPLPETTLQTLQRDFEKRYSFKVEPFLDPNDALRSRIYREFKKKSMSIIDIKKVKSVLAQATPKTHEAVALAAGLKLEFDAETTTAVRSVVDYYFALRTLAMAWAWSGNFITKSKDNKDVLMIDLSTAMSYPDLALHDAMLYGQGSLTWISRNDTATRGRMATLIRQGWAAGEALNEALRLTHLEWRSPSLHGVVPEPEPQMKKRAAPPPEQPDVQPKRQRQLKADTFTTVSMAKGGRKICKAWNDGRGCGAGQKCDSLHVCDVKLASGKACLSTKHSRLQHSDAKE